MRISVSSDLVPFLDGLASAEVPDIEIGTDPQLSYAMHLLSDRIPDRIVLTSKKIELLFRLPGEDLKVEVSGKGLSPIRNPDDFADALSRGLARGELDRIEIKQGDDRLFRLDLSNRGLEVRNDDGFIKVKGNLPDSLQEISELGFYLSNLPLLLGGMVSPRDQKEIIRTLSAYGLKDIEIGTGNDVMLDLSFSDKSITLSTAFVGFRLEGSFGRNWGDVAQKLFKIVQGISDDDFVDPISLMVSLLDGFGIKGLSMLSPDGHVMARIAGPFNTDAMNYFLDGIELPAGSELVLTDWAGQTGETGDAVLGSARGDVVDGLGGNDTILGHAGNDDLMGGEGDDLLIGGEGDDSMSGGAGNDLFQVDGDDMATDTEGGMDTVVASDDYALGEGIETLILLGRDDIDGTGNELDNRLEGNAGDNVLDGGAGNDTMVGYGGDDTYIFDSEGDQATEAAVRGGTDTVQSFVSVVLGANIERLELLGDGDADGTGNDLSNRITGNLANNLLSGGRGDDTVVGAGGDDTVTGGLGRDRLEGGDGADVFRFLAVTDSSVSSRGRDTIEDFETGLDRIDLTGLDAIRRTAADDAFTFIGSGRFTGDAGQLRFQNGSLMADTNGDRRADFQIDVDFADGSGPLTAADFLL